MAQTAEEYREQLLRQLSGDADIAERTVNYLTTHELPYAETPAFHDVIQEQIATTNLRKEYLRTLVDLVENTQVGD